MCDCFKDPTRPEEETDLATLEKLPQMAFTNITGGEPFIRKDIADIVELLYKKTPRIVISTNGYFTDRLSEVFPMVLTEGMVLCRNLWKWDTVMSDSE